MEILLIDSRRFYFSPSFFIIIYFYHVSYDSHAKYIAAGYLELFRVTPVKTCVTRSPVLHYQVCDMCARANPVSFLFFFLVSVHHFNNIRTKWYDLRLETCLFTYICPYKRNTLQM